VSYRIHHVAFVKEIDYAMGNVSSMGLARFSHIFSLKYAWGK
jgi:hypothetical protein